VDFVEFKEHPINLLRKKEFNLNIPVILGTNLNEGSTLFHLVCKHVDVDKNLNVDNYFKCLVDAFGEQWGSKIFNMYNPKQKKERKNTKRSPFLTIEEGA